MKERPILFSGAMVRALMDGTKTQTRRVVKGSNYVSSGGAPLRFTLRDIKEVPCPYGQPGDRIWVRESFCPIYPKDPHYNGGRPIEYDYAATYKHGDRLGDLIGVKKKWKPSIHMPRAACRITLEITGMRVERLQDISDADAVAEGVAPDAVGRPDDDADAFWRIGAVRDDSFPIARYAALWESINGPGSWDANPWVWVVEFRLVKPGEVNQQGVQR